MNEKIIERNGETYIVSSNAVNLDIDNLVENINNNKTIEINQKNNTHSDNDDIDVNFEFKINNKKHTLSSKLIKFININKKINFTVLCKTSEAAKSLDIIHSNSNVEINSIIIKSNFYKTKLSNNKPLKISSFTIKKKKNMFLCKIEIHENI